VNRIVARLQCDFFILLTFVLIDTNVRIYPFHSYKPFTIKSDQLCIWINESRFYFYFYGCFK